MASFALLLSIGSTLARWMESYGYLGLAVGVFLESVGIPVPGETALVASAFAAAHGTLTLPLVILTAAVAGILGDNLGYVLGRRLGRPWAERHGRWVLLTPERLARVDGFFQRRGPAAVALARFIAGARVAAAFAAGMGQMPWPLFLRYNIIGAALWATVTGLGGYALGRSWQNVGPILGHAGGVVLVIVPAVVLCGWLFIRVRRWWIARDADHWVRRLAARWGWVLAMSMTATLAFAKVAEDVAEHETAPFDDAVRAWVMGHHSALLDGLLGGATWMGSGVVLAPLALATAIWLARRRGPALAVVTLASPLGAAGAILLLKWAFHRARPEGAALLADPTYSFPSGHTTAVTAVALTIAYVLRREGIGPRWLPVVAAGLAVMVGLTRIYLDVHWATDIIGGWSVGAFIATGSAALYEAVCRDGGRADADTLAPRTRSTV